MKIFILIFVLTTTVYAAADLSKSSLKLIKGSEELCPDGPLQVVGGDTLMVGANITFSLAEKVEESPAADGKCRESVKTTKDAQKISQLTKISNCSPELKRLENETYEELQFLTGQVQYIHRRGVKTTTCLFERKLK